MKRERININGVDITRYVVKIDATLDEVVSGLRSTGLVTISGVWDDGRLTCVVCHERFIPGPEGAAWLTLTSTNERIVGVVCPACGTLLTAPADDAVRQPGPSKSGLSG